MQKNVLLTLAAVIGTLMGTLMLAGCDKPSAAGNRSQAGPPRSASSRFKPPGSA